METSNILVDKTYGTYCEEIGAEYNICPELLEAIIEEESSGNPNALGKDGDTGLMQIIPRFHKDRMEELNVSSLYDPYSNILVATDYLSELFTKYEDVGTVLMVYNGVSDAMDREYSGDYTDYADEIIERSAELEREHGK